MIKFLLFLIILVLSIVVYAKYIERTNVFFPSEEIEATPEILNLDYDDIYIDTEDSVKINGWFIPNDKAEYTLLFFHGNGGNISNRLDKIKMLYDLDLSIFIIDYRGYGRSKGSPTEEGLYLDALTSYNYLVNKRKIENDRIIVYGESLGTVVAVDLAQKKDVKAIVLEGAISSGRDLAKIYYPYMPTPLFSIKLDSESKIKEVNVPKLFLHSKEDEIVPIKLARKLYEVSPEPKEFIELRGGHSSAYQDSKEKYLSSIKSFIDLLKNR